MSMLANHLSFAYKNEPIVSNLDFKFSAGEIVGIIGPNGAGKSTIIKLLSKVLEPSFGFISVDGIKISDMSRLDLAKQIAVVSQISDLPESFRVEDIVLMGRTPHLGFLSSEKEEDFKIVEAVMQKLDILKFKTRQIASLSGGERQRVVLARALAQEPKYLLLDEPTNHLDLNYSIELLRFLKREVTNGLAVLIIMHDLSLASQICDRIIVIEDGQLVGQGKTEEVISELLIKNVFRTDVKIIWDENNKISAIVPNI